MFKNNAKLAVSIHYITAMAKKTGQRANVSLDDLELSEAELKDLLGITDDDTWEAMSNAQKLLILAKRGIKATQKNLKKDEGE